MDFLDLLRYLVFFAFLASAVIALASTLVRNRQVNPFSPLGRTLRSISEPFVRPMERWIVKRGGNPQNAGWWIIGIALVGGIIIISGSRWLVEQFVFASAMASGGPRGIIRMVVLFAGRLVLLAILIRVIASFFGQFRYSKWMRPVYLLTDWIIEPLRRIIPPIGMFDFTPLIAWFGVQLLLGLLMRIL